MEPSSHSADPSSEKPAIVFKRPSSRVKGNLSKRRRVADESDESSGDDGPEQNTSLARKSHNRGIVASSSAEKQSKELFATAAQADRHNLLADTDYATKQSALLENEGKKLGPKRSANVRYTTTTDFAADVCKDFKITGYCGFGDGCRFAHDRSNVKQGWQLDREWETITKGRKNMGGTVVAAADRSLVEEGNSDENEDSSSARIPPKCMLCDDEYKSPVLTKCGHIFCEQCALKSGVFNSASNLVKKSLKKED
ncbi:hypothetical protein Trco_007509 [Trichoderma cornu-damae]|uniref:Pre-mRNA-splicing factor CWC24 n=1 Tax=Trichoderma cornu-damae TaxID=654480 RepID=A0A9P8QJW8_9HYPO|nr:hypothetical protein Trco_007509 [Trichoderma cornu-damae]